VRSLVPKVTGLARDLDEYLSDYDLDRAHTRRLTKRRARADIVFGARKTRPGDEPNPSLHLGVRTAWRLRPWAEASRLTTADRYRPSGVAVKVSE
jgi:hypothetical protein